MGIRSIVVEEHPIASSEQRNFIPDIQFHYGVNRSHQRLAISRSSVSIPDTDPVDP